MSMSAYARHRKERGLPGATLYAVQVAIESGRLRSSVTRAKKIRSAELADAEWSASTKADHVPITGPTAPPPPVVVSPVVNALAEARARRESAQAELREMELGKKRGELVSAKEVEAKLAGVFMQCRVRLLEIPRKARQHDASLSAAHLVLLEGLIRQALEDLADPEESDATATAE